MVASGLSGPLWWAVDVVRTIDSFLFRHRTSQENSFISSDSDSRVLVLQGYGSEVRIEAAPVPPVGEAEAAEDACKQRNHDSGQVYLNF